MSPLAHRNTSTATVLPMLRRQSGIAGLKRLRELTVDAQRAVIPQCVRGRYNPALAGQNADPADAAPLPRLRLVAQEPGRLRRRRARHRRCAVAGDVHTFRIIGRY